MIVPKTEALSFRLDCLNWPEAFPYKPEVDVRIWHSGDAIHLEYKVNEATVRALQCTPGGFVYEDSCVEFFIQPDPADPHYYNFEWNAIGNLYLAWRTGRKNPELAPAEVLDRVRAEASLGCKPFAEHPADTPWTLKLTIPAAALWHNDIKDFSGLKAKANFYKCGDGLATPHYVSWAPVETEKPDYHRPEFFASLEFEP